MSREDGATAVPSSTIDDLAAGGAGAAAAVAEIPRPVIDPKAIQVPDSVRQAADEVIGHSSLNTVVLNILACVVGGAVLSLPSAFERLTLIPGIIMLAVTSYLAWFAVVLVGRTCARTGILNFIDLMEHAQPYPAVKHFASCGFVALPFGVITAFAKVIGDSMPAIIKFALGKNEGGNEGAEGGAGDAAAGADAGHIKEWYLQEWFWLSVTCVVLIPLCSFREMNELAVVTLVGIATVVITGAFIAFRWAAGTYTVYYAETALAAPSGCSSSFLNLTNQSVNASTLGGSRVHPTVALFLNKPHSGSGHSSAVEESSMIESFFIAFSTMTMAQVMVHLLPSFYLELRRRSERRITKAVKVAGYFASSFYLLVAVTGYFTFGSSIVLAHGNILNCFGPLDKLITIGRVLMTLHFVSVYPVNAIGCRRMLNRLIYGISDESKISQFKLCLEATVLVGGACLTAFCVSGIEVVYAINGALFGMSFAYILPSFCYMRLVNPCRLDDLWKSHRDAMGTSSSSEDGDDMSDSERPQELSEVAAAVVGAGSSSGAVAAAAAAGLPSSPPSTAVVEQEDEDNDIVVGGATPQRAENENEGGETFDRTTTSAARSPDALDRVVQSSSFVLKSGSYDTSTRTSSHTNNVDDGDDVKTNEKAMEQREKEENASSAAAPDQDQPHYLHHHPRPPIVDPADLTAPRTVKARSSIWWRLTVVGMFWWGCIGMGVSIIFTLHAILSGKENQLKAE